MQKPRKRTLRSGKITCNGADRTAHRVNGAMKWRMGIINRYMQNCEAELLLSPLISFSKNQAAGLCVSL